LAGKRGAIPPVAVKDGLADLKKASEGVIAAGEMSGKREREQGNSLEPPANAPGRG
jgi:hypothetical protein